MQYCFTNGRRAINSSPPLYLRWAKALARLKRQSLLFCVCIGSVSLHYLWYCGSNCVGPHLHDQLNAKNVSSLSHWSVAFMWRHSKVLVKWLWCAILWRKFVSHHVKVFHFSVYPPVNLHLRFRKQIQTAPCQYHDIAGRGSAKGSFGVPDSPKTNLDPLFQKLVPADLNISFGTPYFFIFY